MKSWLQGIVSNLPKTPGVVVKAMGFGRIPGKGNKMNEMTVVPSPPPLSATITQQPVTEQRPDDVMPDDDDYLDKVDKYIADANAASIKDNRAAAKSRSSRATPLIVSDACPVDPVEQTKTHTENVKELLTINGKKGVKKRKKIYIYPRHDESNEGKIQESIETVTDSQIQEQLRALTQISECVSAQEAAIYDENMEKVTALLAETRDTLGPDRSKLLFEGTAMEGTAMKGTAMKGTTMGQIRMLVDEVLPVEEFRTSLKKLTPEQLKELASYIVLKHKAMEVNKPMAVPNERPYNGIPFFTQPSQPSPLQICFLPGETLASRGLVREPEPEEEAAVKCVLEEEEIGLVTTQRAFVSANPNIATMHQHCSCDLESSALYSRRLTAEQFFQLKLDASEITATNDEINVAAGLWASAFGSPTPPDYFSKLKFIVPSAPFGSPTAPPPPPEDPPPPGGDPYTVLYDFTNKVGPRVSIPYIPANYRPNPFPDPDWSAPFPSVMVGRKRLLYSIGPILFDNHLFGRPLIMIRLHNYKTALHPDGIYFWVYPSFSESGLARVYFTIDGGLIIKGIDYTITTFVLEFLQVEINRYYVRHYVNKLPNRFFPTKLTTPLQILNFFGEMIHLQDQWVYDFLCGLGIILSPYVRDHAPIPPDFNRHCYVFYSNPRRALADPPPAPPAPPAPPPGFPPFYPDDPRSLQLADLVGPNYSPTTISTLRGCVSHGISLREFNQERMKTKREDDIFASFMSMNAIYRGDDSKRTFPLRLCISTVMDTILVPVVSGDVQRERLYPQNIGKDWPFVPWVQGCEDLGRGSTSPLIPTIGGVTPELKYLADNEQLATDGFAPQILAKQYLDSRLLTTTVTQNQDEAYELSTRKLRSGTVFNRDVHFITFVPDIVDPIRGALPLLRELSVDGNGLKFSPRGREYMLYKFSLLPRAIKMSVERMADLFCDSNPVYNDVKVSFERLLRIPRRRENSSPLILPNGDQWGTLFNNAAHLTAAAAAANPADLQAYIVARLTAAATPADLQAYIAAATPADLQAYIAARLTAAATAATAAAPSAELRAYIDARDARDRLLQELQIHILIKSNPVLAYDGQGSGNRVLKVDDNSPLDVIKKTMEVTGVYRHSIASSIFQSFLDTRGFKLTPPEDGVFPPDEEVKLYYLDKLGQYRSIEPTRGENPRNFLSCFTSAEFDPYIIDSVRESESISPVYLKEFLLGRNVTRDQLPVILQQIQQGGQIKSAKVFSKMFLLRLLFKNGNNRIQLVVSVSSTITIAGNSRKYVPFATDLQFTPTFIGPVDVDVVDGTVQTLETVIATAVRYISAGCSVATKPADYSQFSGSAQYLKFLEVFFRQFCSVCYTYDSTQISSFNCQHDPMLKFLTSVFSNQDAITAITGKWQWEDYLTRQHGYNLADQSALTGQNLRQNILSMLVENRLRMLAVCRILIDPMLQILAMRKLRPPRGNGGPRSGGPGSGGPGSGGPPPAGNGSPPYSSSGESMSMSDSGPSSTGSTSVSSTNSLNLFNLGSESWPPADSSDSFRPPPSPSPASSASPTPLTPGQLYMSVALNVPPVTSTSIDPRGGSLTNKKYTKKNNHKSQDKNRTNSKNSKNRKTTRKNGKFKRMIKKHTTKYKTYKRKAFDSKLRGNKHRNNKTMRRYRCVRK
jgi:hypothetical protein